MLTVVNSDQQKTIFNRSTESALIAVAAAMAGEGWKLIDGILQRIQGEGNNQPSKPKMPRFYWINRQSTK